MEDALKIVIPFLLFLVLILSVRVIESLRRRAAWRRGRQATERPATEPPPDRFRFPPGPASPPSPGTAEPTPPPPARLAASASRPERTPPAAPPARGGPARRPPPARAIVPMPSGPTARMRIRRLLRDPGGRRAAILAHEILRPPPGLEERIAERNLPEVERM